MIPIILSGGSGTRLWPLSRADHPKQFLPLTGQQKTLFQLTLERARDLALDEPVEPPIIVGSEKHRFVLAEQAMVTGVRPHTILLEPVGRNTAPAIAAAALAALTQGTDPLLLVLPADHVIADAGNFASAVQTACDKAQEGALVTFGVVPQGPETGYGYIRLEEPSGTHQAIKAEAFVEKPDLAKAREYVADGRHLWNSGMFLFKASIFLSELERWNPAMLAAVRSAYEGARQDLDFTRLEESSFAACPSDSIDYAVMEKSDRVFVVPLDAGWNDVGAWEAVWQVGDKDSSGNVIRGDVVVDNCKSSLVQAEHRLVTLLGVDNLVVVETSDAVLVTSRAQAQHVKHIVEHLLRQRRTEATQHRKVYRPWGSYDSIASGNRYQVKCIIVRPGEKLSVQMHHHRAEHWVVVSGTAKVFLGDKEILLTENQSTYIPLGVVHALENPGKIPLELIEVQSGAYLGEDDIVRFDDRYGRTR